jgi:hypothetical protein
MWKRIVAVALGLMPGAAQACAYLEPFEMGRIEGGDLVVVGEVTGFQMVEEVWGAALVTVDVEEALKGEASGEVTFIWNSGMAMGPHETRAKGRVLIAATKGGRMAAGDLAPDARPDLPSIVQPYCGEVWMLPATAAAVTEAREVLE